MNRPDTLDRLARIAPGLPALLHYRRADLSHDLVAGLSVAAVALPVGVAYAQLAGFTPVVGLYASILPLVAYALFGTSRQLIVGPDAATCALVAAAVAPLAAGDPEQYLSVSIAVAALAGLICVGASFLRLGAIADFLSKPILVGFLNGVSLHIVVGQLGKLFGFSIEAPPGIVTQILALLQKIEQTHCMVPDLPVLRMAYLIERDFAEFYETSACKADGQAKTVLESLAAWERNHERFFKHMHDRVLEQYGDMPWGG